MSRAILTILFVSFLYGCSSYVKAKYEPTTWLFKPDSAPIAAKTVYSHNGATVLSPNESDWYLIAQEDIGVMFGRMYGSPEKTGIIFSQIVKYESIESDTDFLNHVAEQMVELDDKERFKILDITNEQVTFKNTACLKYKWLSEDHKNSGIDSKDFQYYKIAGYFCRHPANKNFALRMEVSHRSNEEKFPEELLLLGEEYFSDLQFNNIGFQ
jgi:hypothetical protein